LAEKPVTSLLDQISCSADVKKLRQDQLRWLADEVRADMIDTVSRTGGHLGAGLGVVELTVALHAVFDTPRDRLIWDVGHQCYPHKILTGRRDRIRTLRQGGGLSGFTNRRESAYDPFGAAHSSTSISAALGFAVARDLGGAPEYGLGESIAVIGDGALSAGMAYEAMNNAGHLGKRMFVILNDNEMSIAPPVGAMSAYLSRLYAGAPFQEFKAAAKGAISLLPEPFQEGARRAKEMVKSMTVGGTLFEELGFSYVGPINGHDMSQLLAVLRTVRDRADKPMLIHVLTQKGKGYPPAEAARDKYHGVSKFNVVSGKQQKAPTNAPGYTRVFADSLIDEAARDDKIVAVTAAMPDGTGLDLFAERFPARCFDVGIAEQHAVTFAGGLSVAGKRPFVAIYSTFLQRAFDQIIHDICIQKLPVTFCMDRAGIVGADGATHTGMFDLAFMRSLPNMTVMAPKDEAELRHMLATALTINGPVAIRYPRGNGYGVELVKPQVLPVGRCEILEQGDDGLVIAIGNRVRDALSAVETLRKEDERAYTLLNLRFIKPLDETAICKHLQTDKPLVVIEEGVTRGGIGEQIAALALTAGWHGPFIHIAMPDRFPAHGTQAEILRDLGLDADGIISRLRSNA